MCPYGPFEWGGRVSCSKLAFLGSVWVQVVEQEELGVTPVREQEKKVIQQMKQNKTKKSKAGLAFTGALVVGGGCPGPVLSLGGFPRRPRDRLDPAAGSSPGWRGDQTRGQSRQMDGRTQQSFPGRPERKTLLPGRNPQGRAEDWMGRQPPRLPRSQEEGRCLFERICWLLGKRTLKQQRGSKESTRFLHKTPRRHRNRHHGTLQRRWRHKGTGRRCVHEASPQPMLPRQRKTLAYSPVGGEPYFLEMVGKNCWTGWQTWAGLPMLKKNK